MLLNLMREHLLTLWKDQSAPTNNAHVVDEKSLKHGQKGVFTFHTQRGKMKRRNVQPKSAYLIR